jgi:CHAT domain/WD domain, G-beta repeat
VGKEKDHLAKALAGDSSIQLTWAPSATWADLHDVLLSGTWHVVHFIGHGDFDPARDEGVLALTGEDGRKDLVEASRLVDLLRQADPVPRLVVLNSCSGAASGVTDLFSGTAAALVRGGVTAVAAMQYEITDPAAVAFARGFYGAIARGRGVDEAVSSGRVAIIGLSSRTLEWVTPVLYLRGSDSHLFTVPAAQPAAEAGGQPQPGRPVRAPVPARMLRALTGQSGWMGPVAFSPDGRVLAAAGGEGTTWLWDTATWTLIHAFSGHDSRHMSDIEDVAFSPDGTLLACAGADLTARLWETATGLPVRTLTFKAVASGVAFSPDGQLLASAGRDRTVRLWDTATGTLAGTLTSHRGEVRGVSFSPDGALLVSSGHDGTVRVWG